MKTRIPLWIVTVALGISQAAGGAQDLSQPTDFQVRLLQPLSTATSKECDPVRAEVESPDKFKGDFMSGFVNHGTGSNRNRSYLNFSFNELRHAGQPIAVEGRLTDVKNSQGKENVDEEGHVVSYKRHKARNILVATGIGTVLGGLTHGPVGAATGAAAGAATGLLVVEFAAKAPKISFAPGSEFGLSVKLGKKQALSCPNVPSQ